MVTWYVLQPLVGRWMDQEGLFSGIKKKVISNALDFISHLAIPSSVPVAK